jgi:hypothetical protein
MTIGRESVHEIVVARAGRLAALEHGGHAHSSEKSHWPGLELLPKRLEL